MILLQFLKNNWNKKIQFGIKGEDYNEIFGFGSLLEGIKGKPLLPFRKISKQKIPFLSLLSTWKITEAIYARNPEIANKKLRAFLEKGAGKSFFYHSHKWYRLFKSS